jgi:mannose-6-phosphate isomerase-like protein (cupin superfamily)
LGTQKPLVIDLLDNSEYQSLLRGEPKTCGMRSGRVFLKPGEECGEHSTGAREELLVFLSGNGQAEIEGELLDVGAGKVVYIPPETTHNIRNNSDAEPLSYIYCVAPAG